MRTEAQQIAAFRDGTWCLWGRYYKGELLTATEVHHLARRQPGADLPELCISLSQKYHAAHHRGGEPTTVQLLDLMREVYGYDLRRDFPLFFGHLD